MVIRRVFSYMLLGVILSAALSCQQRKAVTVDNNQSKTWKEELRERLPLMGHRNWILVVDKAFPLQTAPGMEYMYVDEPLPQVLEQLMNEVHNETHIKPIVYRDKELSFIEEADSPGISDYRKQLDEVLKGLTVQTLVHDSVFKQLDDASKLFKVLVIKTNETLAYSSVFVELDCKYWDGEKESKLRKAIALP